MVHSPCVALQAETIGRVYPWFTNLAFDFTSFPDWGTSCNAYRRNVRVNTSTRRYIEQDKDFSPLWNKSKGSHFKEFENRPVFFSIEKYGRVSYSIIAKNCEIWTSLYRSVNTADIKKMIKHKIRNNLVWHSRH